MNGRVAKRLRRENGPPEPPELNMSFDRNRRVRRSRYVDRSFTRPGFQRLEIIHGHPVFRKARHIIMDHLEERERPTRTNHERMLGRQKAREAVRALHAA